MDIIIQFLKLYTCYSHKVPILYYSVILNLWQLNCLAITIVCLFLLIFANKINYFLVFCPMCVTFLHYANTAWDSFSSYSSKIISKLYTWLVGTEVTNTFSNLLLTNWIIVFAFIIIILKYCMA